MSPFCALDFQVQTESARTPIRREENVMAINSSAFGRVTLTDDDAKKFERQVRYGRPTEQARTSVAQGRSLAAAFMASNGSLTEPKRK